MIDERNPPGASGAEAMSEAQGTEFFASLEEPFPKVYAITLNWNGKDDTLELLDSLRRLDYPNHQVLVVDNGSEDDSVEAIGRMFPDVTVIENGRNLGYADGFNVGLEYAYRRGADYFLVLNNDTMIDSSAMMELVKVAEMDDDVGFVSGKVYLYDEPDTLQTVGRRYDPMILAGRHVGDGEVDVGQYDEVRDYEFMDDVYLLVRRKVYEELGGYDPNFFLYYEETDWCARVRRAGYRIVYAPGAKIWHKGNIGGPSTSRSPERHYFMTRNRVIFLARNTSVRHVLRYLFWSLGKELLDAARYVRHGYVRHPLARFRGLGSGIVWLLKNRGAGARARA